MRKILYLTGFFIAALVAKATDGANSVTIGGHHLVNITAVVQTSPTTVMINSDGQLMQLEIKSLPARFLGAWGISKTPPVLACEPGQNHTIHLPDAVNLELIWINPGTFTMGSPNDEAERARDEGPQTVVTISKGFWLEDTPVTQEQYRAVMGNNPSEFTNIGVDAPVEKVSWDEAMDFCQSLTELERAAGHLPKGYVYTLPTEAQWEYACRAGTTESRYGNLNNIAWFLGNNTGHTHPVARKEPNDWGLYDMNGNVWQWCSDWYGPYHGGNVTDPVGAPPNTVRVMRGGSWDDASDYCRSACRYWVGPDRRENYIGFRVALSTFLSANPPSGK
jgi:formylglycine-generating enzyme required for sulfatase activity